MPEFQLLVAAVAGIAFLLFLIIALKLHAFAALMLSSVLIGLVAGMEPAAVLESVTRGMGGTLGTIAVLVGLGAMFGQMLEASGGAQRVAELLLNSFGESRAQWSLALTGFIVAIPVFFDVGFIILVPLVFGLAHRTARPVTYFGLPLLAGLAATHAFIPPTPGPIAVAELLGADLGWVVLFGALCGAPATVVAGPVYASFISRHVTAGVPEELMPAPAPEGEAPDGKPLPSTGLVLGLIVIPLVLILVSTTSKALLAEGSLLRDVLLFIGNPVIALLISCLLCFRLLGLARGYSRDEVSELANKALEPAGIIILVTGAGGVLKQTLIDSGVGDVLASQLLGTGLPVLVLGFLIAWAMRLMQGSATVAMLTAAGLASTLLADASLSAQQNALLVVCIAAGATATSHVNDSGFWLVNRYFGLSVPDTLRTWTAASSLIGFCALIAALFLGALL
ncbi:MAG: gluconate:H+ symporter [Myxococcota bacterium]